MLAEGDMDWTAAAMHFRRAGLYDDGALPNGANTFAPAGALWLLPP